MSDDRLRLLRQMVRIRRLEERCAELYAAAKIRGFLHLYIGEEAVAVGVIDALPAGDPITAAYREHGHALVRGVPARAILAEMFGRVEGCSHGRGGSMHLFDAAARFYGGHAIVGSGIPAAIGMALAEKTLATGNISVCFFGEGAVAEGAFHESINLAAIWRLPVLLVCENNGYAMGTALPRWRAQTDLCAFVAGYGVAAESVDGMDVEAVREAAGRLASAVRDGAGPRFLECRTYRFRAHSMFDPELYRSRAEVDEWKRRDPINALVRRLEQDGTDGAAQVAAIEREVAAELDDAIAFAEAGTLEPVADITRNVYTPRAQP